MVGKKEVTMPSTTAGSTTKNGSISKFLGPVKNNQRDLCKKPMITSTDPKSSYPPLKTYRGVRCRRWGRWVSEIREPNKRSRIWLGSFPTAEMAARAYDAALVCLRGPKAAAATLNFPDSPPLVSFVRESCHSPKDVQAAAAAAAAASEPCLPLSISKPIVVLSLAAQLDYMDQYNYTAPNLISTQLHDTHPESSSDSSESGTESDAGKSEFRTIRTSRIRSKGSRSHYAIKDGSLQTAGSGEYSANAEQQQQQLHGNNWDQYGDSITEKWSSASEKWELLDLPPLSEGDLVAESPSSS
ncbi:unnamed protein product [Sphagnum troendelagicum]